MKKFLFFFIVITACFTNAQEIVDKEAFKKCRKEFSKKICISDRDNDATLNYLDLCPDEKGSIENDGCPWPDYDGDSVLDKDDACPSVAGPEENNGCPWPDIDGDGILDKDDACPTVEGLVEENGCPKTVYESYRYSTEELDVVKKKFLEKTKNFNYHKLADFIFSKISKEEFTSNVITLEIASFYQMAGCGFDRTDYSPHNLKINLASEKFWDQRNFKKFVDRFPTKIVYPYSENKEVVNKFRSFGKVFAKEVEGMRFYNAKNYFKNLNIKEINYEKNFNIYIFFSEEDDNIFVKFKQNTGAEPRVIQVQIKGNSFIQTN